MSENTTLITHLTPTPHLLREDLSFLNRNSITCISVLECTFHRARYTGSAKSHEFFTRQLKSWDCKVYCALHHATEHELRLLPPLSLPQCFVLVRRGRSRRTRLPSAVLPPGVRAFVGSCAQRSEVISPSKLRYLTKCKRGKGGRKERSKEGMQNTRHNEVPQVSAYPVNGKILKRAMAEETVYILYKITFISSSFACSLSAPRSIHCHLYCTVLIKSSYS